MASLISPLTSGGVTAALNSIIHSTGGSGGAGSADDPRTPIVFGSDMRRVVAAGYRSRRDAFLTGSSVSVATGDLAGIGANSDLLNITRGIVDAPIVDLTNQMQGALSSITMAINPNSIEFDQPKRMQRMDTITGTTFHHFTDDKGQNNDLMTIKFAGNTGNIFRKGTTREDVDRALLRLRIWHNLYQLTREPVLLTDGSYNTMYVTYVSPLFPVPIEFAGFWDKVLRFTEDAKKTRSRNYSMEFVVQATTPDINTISSIILDTVTAQAQTLPVDTSKILGQ